jgi:hypothetical protein
MSILPAGETNVKRRMTEGSVDTKQHHSGGFFPRVPQEELHQLLAAAVLLDCTRKKGSSQKKSRVIKSEI